MKLASRFVAFHLTLAGILVAWILSLAHLFGKSLPCGDDSGCDTVAQSAVSHIGSVPIAFFGLVAYVALALIAYRDLVGRPLQWSRAAFPICVLGCIANTALTAYAALFLHAMCRWCVASNVIFALLTLLYASSRPASPESGIDARKVRRLAVPGICVFVLALATSSFAIRRTLDGFDARAIAARSIAQIAPADSLATAPASAAPTAVVFVDFSCQTCHEFVPKLLAYAQSKGVRVVVRHCPLSVHPDAEWAAELAEEMSSRGCGWQFVRSVLSVNAPSRGRMMEIAERCAGTDRAIQVRPAAIARVLRDREFAASVQIRQTPCIILLRPGSRAATYSSIGFEAQFFGGAA